MKVAVIGAGWAGMAAAVHATRLGHGITVFEASRQVGGRARALEGHLPDGTHALLDNGQHILIGAYSETLRLMREVGVQPEATLLRLPLALQFPDGTGLALPAWPAPLDALAGILGAKGWGMKDKASLVYAALNWQLKSFRCGAEETVATLCKGVSARVMQELIDPLCVSALNTPAAQASAQTFLTVLRDSLFGGRGSSNLLLPKVDLSSLFPQPAAEWLTQHGGQVRLGCRIPCIAPTIDPGWDVAGEAFDAVIFATSPSNVPEVPISPHFLATTTVANELLLWRQLTETLRFEAITTVYAWARNASLNSPILALRSSTGDTPCPAQFVFDRGQLGGPPGLLAFVVSASHGEKDGLQAQVLAQARQQLGLNLQAVQTVVEKRATFACSPGLQRPKTRIAPGLLACGDYLDGPYPATLEGAVRSGLVAAAML